MTRTFRDGTLGWPEIWPENWAATSDLFDSAQELGGLQPLILRGIRPQEGASSSLRRRYRLSRWPPTASSR